jgi:hypothetical protein
MERFFDGMDQENSKPQGGKGQIRKIQKNKKERMEERKKKRDFYVRGGFHTHVFSISWECPGATALVRPSLRRTHSDVGTSPTTKVHELGKKQCPRTLMEFKS